MKQIILLFGIPLGVAMFSFGLPHETVGQDTINIDFSSKNQTQCDGKINVVRNSNGWDVTEQTDALLKNATSRNESRMFEGIKVDITRYDISGDNYFVLNDYYLSSGFEMRIRSFDVVFYRIYKFERNGRHFASKIEFVPANKDTQTRAGAVLTYFFIDEIKMVDSKFGMNLTNCQFYRLG